MERRQRLRTIGKEIERRWSTTSSFVLCVVIQPSFRSAMAARLSFIPPFTTTNHLKRSKNTKTNRWNRNRRSEGNENYYFMNKTEIKNGKKLINLFNFESKKEEKMKKHFFIVDFVVHALNYNANIWIRENRRGQQQTKRSIEHWINILHFTSRAVLTSTVCCVNKTVDCVCLCTEVEWIGQMHWRLERDNAFSKIKKKGNEDQWAQRWSWSDNRTHKQHKRTTTIITKNM